MDDKDKLEFNQLYKSIKNDNDLFTDNSSDIFNDEKEYKEKKVNIFHKFNDRYSNKLDRVKELFQSKKFIMITSLLILVFTSMTVIKTFYYHGKVLEYEDFFTVIEKKEANEAIINEGEGVSTELIKGSSASELVNCINEKVDVNDLPDSIKGIIQEINNYYNQSNNYFAFAYKDIYTGFMVSYNENQAIFTASTIKGPTDLYIYEMASMGKINLDEELRYTGRYYNTGSGVLKNKSVNTNYSVRTLLNYSTVYSDNAAHNMLMDRYGRENMYNFWSSLGTTAIFTANNNWGITNAHDAVIYMSELYRFYLENEEYGKEVMDNFLNASPKFIQGYNNYLVANKSGWSGTAIHDVSIVFANNPYIVVALSNLGDTDYYASYFYKANNYAKRLHEEYWKYKMEKCGMINQY